MTNEEKIRLVLETLGTDNVKQANRVLRQMQEELVKVGDASTKAAGRRGVNGQGLLQLAYFVDDMQYGMRGIMNNIPGLIQSLGLGAGLAGVAGIAAVAVGTLVEKHPEWFEWSNKVKESLKELTDAIKAEEEAVKRQKSQVDKLGESNSKRIEDILKLKQATESLEEAEKKLAENRKNAKATEDADKNAGVLADEELNRQKEIVKSVITDAGLQKQVRDELTKQVERTIPEIGGESIDKESRRIASERVPFFAKMQPDRQNKIAETFRGQALATLQTGRNEQIQQSVQSIFGGLINPANQGELDQAMQSLDQLLPGVSRELREVYRFDRENEAFEAKNNRWRRGKGAELRRAERDFAAGEAAAARIGPNRAMFDEVQRRQFFADQAEQQAESARQAEIRNAVLNQMDPAQMAALRNAQAGMGPMRGRNLRQLEERDLALFSNALMERGMGRGEAQQAATESLIGGRTAFQEFANSIGKNLDNSLRAQEASVEFFRMMQARMDEFAMRQQMLMQQMNVLGGTNQQQARPPARVRN